MCYPLIALMLAATDPAVANAEKLIDPASMLKRTKTLASDAFEGRSPGTKGEDVTVAYLTAQMKQIGLEPGNPDGTYVQRVPLVSATATYKGDLETAGKHQELVANRDIVAATHRLVRKVSIDKTDMVFVGYGVVAPEYGWDDFKDLDVRGKTIVMLVNDPQVPDPKDPTKLDPTAFKGKAMTYYGRWVYKYEIAAKKGAAAAIVIHDNEGAGYPWQVVVESWGRENFDTVASDKNAGRSAIEAWMSGEAAEKMLEASGLELATLRKQAASRDFRPVPLKSKLSMTLERTEKQLTSHNVVGKISGSGDRYLIYSAHWDHFGRDDKRQGDRIFHGALDNASGVAAMLELAKAFKALETPLEATIVFLSTTAEERSLLGAKYYVNNPLYPLERTLADLNLDGVNPWGRTSDVVLTGDRNTTLFDTLEPILEAEGRTLSPEPSPEKGFVYRADNFEFAKAGVPSMWCFKGHQYIGKPATYGSDRARDFFAHDYHQVTDTVRSDWDFAGGAEDTRDYFRLGVTIAQDAHWPEWLPGSEWAPKRSESASLRK